MNGAFEGGAKAAGGPRLVGEGSMKPRCRRTGNAPLPLPCFRLRSSAASVASMLLPRIDRDTMKLLGIVLRKPSFGEITAAAIMALGAWIAVAGLAKASGHPLDRGDAGALLIVIAWAAIGTRLGLRLDHGPRHVAAHVAISAVLLGAYQGALAIGAA